MSEIHGPYCAHCSSRFEKARREVMPMIPDNVPNM